MNMNYRVILDRLSEGCKIVGFDWRYLYLNEAACRHARRGRDELLGKRVMEVFPGIEETEIFGRMSACMNDRRADSTETWFSYPDGKSSFFHLNIYPVDEGILVISNEMTERKLVEEALLESEERYRRLFETDTNAIIMADQETLRIIDVNPAAEKMYGYSHEEFLKLTTPDTSAEPKKSTKALAEKQRWIPLRQHRKKDGTVFPVEVSVSYFLYQGREVNVAAIRDISQRKRLEEDARISQAKLIQANKMASLGLLASGITHEISNPNNYILNNLSMLADAWQSSLPILEEYYRENGEFQLGGLPFSQLRDMAPRLFSGTVEGAQRIGFIIDKLKNFVRQDYGTTSLCFDINYIVSGALEMINSEIRKHCDNFTMETCPELPHAYGNPQQIGQVVVNLVLNALQSLPGRGHGVKVRTGMTEQGRNLYITISDEGLGIPNDIIDHITEPFFTTRGDQGGSGLGLYISDSILRDNRGRLSFISEPGKGTIATVLLEVFMNAENKGT
jgi:PAS domain S-box-containing protein